MKKSRILCILLAAALLLTGCAPALPDAPEKSPGGVLSEPEYPDMAPYPDEMSFSDPESGEYDSEGFSTAYSAWRESQTAQYSQPEGYAAGLTPFFQESIPVLLSGEQGANAACSPLNIYLALALLAEVTGTRTRQQLLDLVNVRDMDTLRTQASHVWNAHYCADGASACILANSVWLDEGLTYNSQTLQTLADSYYASCYQGDLGSEEMNTLLRDWINSQTGGLLEEQSGNLSMEPETVLALASTIYYRARWSGEFSESANTQGSFHSPGGDRDVTFMNCQLAYGPYFWGEHFSAVSLPLEDGSQMWLVLPDDGFTPADLLSDGQSLELILQGAAGYEEQKSLRVNLSIPKFDIAADLLLNDTLKALGITDAFDPQAADFRPILPQDNCWLDTVKHAARVAIDEEGVTAAAYTVMMMCGSGMPPEEEVDFVLDRPFLFVITSRDQLPLFAGIVNQP